jgi:hypothetical protein
MEVGVRRGAHFQLVFKSDTTIQISRIDNENEATR